MSESAMDRRRLFVGVLVVVLCTSLLLPIGIDGASATVETDRPADAQIDPDGPTEVRIDPALADADGVVEAIVRFDGGTAVADGRDVATLRERADRSRAPLERAAARTDGFAVERGFWLANAALVTVDTDRVDLADVGAIDGVVEVHENAVVELAATASSAADGAGTASTTDPATVGSVATPHSTAAYTYGLEQLSVPAVREADDARGGGATVAVLDTGVDASHPDLEVDAWRDFSGGSSTPIDYDDHGTHVAGTVVGGDASGTQIGVAPEARLMAGAVLTECDADGCFGETADVLAGMEWAVEQDADVISLSLGFEGYTSAAIDAVREARAAGTVVVAASGNDGVGTSASPGNVYDAIGVGATDEREEVPAFSSGEVVDTRTAWGRDAPDEWPDSYVVPTVVAPGDRVFSATPGGYEYKSGTSMATPHVAGTVALLQGTTERTLTPAEIEAALTETATGADDGPDTRYGHGIVDADAALEAVIASAALEGTVVDRVTGEPIPNATVSAVGPDGTTHGTATDDGGDYALEGLVGDREYAVTVGADGYEPVTADLFLPAGETTVRNATLDGDAAIEVVVDDATVDEPIPDASVAAVSRTGTYHATHAGEGVYRIEDVPSQRAYTLVTMADGYVADRTDVALPTAGTVTERVTLAGDATLEGTVVDRVTEAPVPNATVAVERPDGASIAAETGPDGTVSVTVPGTGGTYALTADAEGYAPAEADRIVASGEAAAVRLEPAGEGRLAVALSDAAVGDPVATGTVAATGDRGRYPAEHVGGGEYVVADVPAVGAYDVTATAPGYVDGAATMGYHAGGTTTAALALEGDGEIDLAVVADDGEPVGDPTVAVAWPSGATVEAAPGSDGTASVAVPGTGGTYTVTADAAGYASASATVTVSSGATESVTVTLAVIDDDGTSGFGAVAAAIATLLVAVRIARSRRG